MEAVSNLDTGLETSKEYGPMTICFSSSQYKLLLTFTDNYEYVLNIIHFNTNSEIIAIPVMEPKYFSCGTKFNIRDFS
ncbi:hypothetical protein NQ315_003177 [Exocentrus adspersus]|uniref:Uncharacterized protein n=1 Tax=Exocentrus adspersus TaxID=1586481 RepID=A0AAV8W4M9_9CUCU|nr:hypothetical protein NQ315_003177 [Exocentrus adspersus]